MSQENFEKLSIQAKNLFGKAFTTNVEDTAYHELEDLTYTDDQVVKRTLQEPAHKCCYLFQDTGEFINPGIIAWNFIGVKNRWLYA